MKKELNKGSAIGIIIAAIVVVVLLLNWVWRSQSVPVAKYGDGKAPGPRGGRTMMEGHGRADRSGQTATVPGSK